jgi:hypothetical protein
MSYNRLKQLVLLLSNVDGEVWLSTPEEVEQEYNERSSRIPEFPQQLTVYEVAGGAVTGPLKVDYFPGLFGKEEDSLIFHYPDGRTAFRIKRTRRAGE